MPLRHPGEVDLSSAAGLTIAGSGKSSGIVPRASIQRGTGSPSCASSVLATALRRHVAIVHEPQPVNGMPANSSIAAT
ncbi:MAG: hypothetical protein DMD74_11830 [Gemmatimonadetes bacterium]|nr:MAG: hypothetical protein DMD74_11830 [Gemmatimonadota bacterium]